MATVDMVMGLKDLRSLSYSIKPIFAGSVDVDEMALKGFLEEAMFLAEYEHVNILTTLGVMWKAGDRPYVVLPYMAKGDLCKLLQKQDLVS